MVMPIDLGNDYRSYADQFRRAGMKPDSESAFRSDMADYAKQALDYGTYSLPVVGPARMVSDVAGLMGDVYSANRESGGNGFFPERNPSSVQPPEVSQYVDPSEFQAAMERYKAITGTENFPQPDYNVGAVNSPEITIEGQARAEEFAPINMPAITPIDTTAVQAQSYQPRPDQVLDQTGVAAQLQETGGLPAPVSEDEARFDQVLAELSGNPDPYIFKNEDSSIGMMLDNMARNTATSRGENYQDRYGRAFAGDDAATIAGTRLASDQFQRALVGDLNQANTIADKMAMDRRGQVEGLNMQSKAMQERLNQNMIVNKLKMIQADNAAKASAGQLGLGRDRLDQEAAIYDARARQEFEAQRQKSDLARLKMALNGGSDDSYGDMVKGIGAINKVRGNPLMGSEEQDLYIRKLLAGLQ